MNTKDNVSRLLEHVGLRATTFYAGKLCGRHDFTGDEDVGHLHVIRAGTVLAAQVGHGKIVVREPTLLFYPQPCLHRLDVDEQFAADVLCASIAYDVGMNNAITQSFPSVLMIAFTELPRIESIISMLFDEAAESRPGRQVMLDRLCDVLLIQMVRYAITQKLVAQGILAGLAHPRLRQAVAKMLDFPAQPWTLDAMATHAHLSRNAFARLFHEIIGETPMDFLTQVRITFAQRLLRRGLQVALVAGEVGYRSQPAFSRAFIRKSGMSPSAWLRDNKLSD